jgi:hypothetical protein
MLNLFANNTSMENHGNLELYMKLNHVMTMLNFPLPQKHKLSLDVERYTGFKNVPENRCIR